MKEFTPEQRSAWLQSLPANPASAGMILVNPSGELLVVKSSYRRHWTIPGGIIDQKESPKHAALREVKEEVGLTINPVEAKFCKAVYRSGEVVDTYKFIFSASISDEAAQSIVIQVSEIESYRFLTKDRIRKSDLVFSPDILQWANNDESAYDEQVVRN